MNHNEPLISERERDEDEVKSDEVDLDQPGHDSESAFEPVIDDTSDLISTRWPKTDIPRFIPYPILACYFFLGVAQALPVTAISWIMMYDVKMSPAVINTVYNLWFQMGLTRPFWAIISDQFPIRGKRRQPYLIMASILSLMFTIAMSTESSTASQSSFIAWGALVFLSWAVAEAMTDSIVVECGNEQVAAAIVHLGLERENDRQQVERRLEYGLDTSPLSPSSASVSRSSGSASGTRIDRLTTLMKARLQSECMSVRTASTVCAYGISIILLKLLSPREVLLVNSISFVPAIFAACTLREHKVKSSFLGMTQVHADGTAALDSDSDDENIPQALSPPRTKLDFLKAKFRQLWISTRVAILPLIFVFLYYAVPNSADTFYYFLYSGSFNFAAWESEMFSFLSLIASLGGTLFYARYLAKISLKPLFVIVTVLGFGVDMLKVLLAENLVQSWMSPDLYVPLIQCIGSFVGGIGNMLPIVLAHTYSPKLLGLEGSMFSVFQMSDRLGVIVSSSLAALMTDRLGIENGSFGLMWLFLLICALLEFVPLLTMPFLLWRKPPPNASLHSHCHPAHTQREMSEVERFTPPPM